MKIFEIVQEAPDSDQGGPLDAGRIRQLYKGKLGDFIVNAYNQPKVRSWSDAIDLGTADYQEWLANQEQREINRNKKELEKERLKRKAGDQEKRGRGEYTHYRDGTARAAEPKSASTQKSYDIDSGDAIGSTVSSIKKKIGKALKKSIPGAQEIDTAKDLAIGGFKRGFNLAKSVPSLKKNR